MLQGTGLALHWKPARGARLWFAAALCNSTTDEVLWLIWEKTVTDLSYPAALWCETFATETSKLPNPEVHGAQDCSWQHSAWKAAKGMGARGTSRSLWRTVASKPGLQRSAFLRFQYVGLEPSPAYCLLHIEEGGQGYTFPSQWGQVLSELSDLQSELLFRRSEHSAVGLCIFTFCSWLTSSRRIWDYHKAQHRSELCSSERSCFGFKPHQDKTFFLFLRVPSTKGRICWHLPLPMCLTGSEPGCHVLQRACLWHIYKNYTVNQVME